MYIDSKYWKNILEKRKQKAITSTKKEYSEEELKKIEKSRKKEQEMNNIMLTKY
jgi:hypothetical protein